MKITKPRIWFRAFNREGAMDGCYPEKNGRFTSILISQSVNVRLFADTLRTSFRGWFEMLTAVDDAHNDSHHEGGG